MAEESYYYAPVTPTVDLRTMLRRKIMQRSIEMMRQAEARRAAISDSGQLEAYLQEVRNAIHRIYAALPVGPDKPISSRIVSRHDMGAYCIENVLFES